MGRVIALVAMTVLIVGIVLLLMSVQSRSVTYTCINSELLGNKTCVFPGYAVIENRVYGDALVSVDGGEPTPLGNGSIVAHVITYIPVIHEIPINNKSKATFNIFNPKPEWVNMSLPGRCIVTINVTLLGSGYVSITAMSDNETVAYSPYTYNLVARTVAEKDLDILIKPAIPLSCPCINTIAIVMVNGTCINQDRAFITAVAHTREQYVDTTLLTESLAVTLIAVAMLMANTVVGSRWRW